MKKALVISWYFPPINSSEGLVTFKLLKNSKYEYDVFTQKNNLAWTYGGNETKLQSNNINTIFSKANDFDTWVNEGIEYYKNHHGEYEYIMTRSMAPESHIIGYNIKKLFPDIKWIASFGDPIYGNPYITLINNRPNPYIANQGLRYLLSPKRIIRKALFDYRKKKYDEEPHNKLIQNTTLDLCDLVILNNPYQKEHMLKVSPGFKDKCVILPHSYDLDFYPKDKIPYDDNKKHFVFLGHLDDKRTPRPLFEAITKLKNEDPHLLENLAFDFYGDLDNDDKVYIIDKRLTDVVHVKDSVTYFESLAIMKNSDYLLSIDADLSEVLDQNIFFPAKIADYLGSGTTIFGITMEKGASSDILRNTGNICLSYSINEIYMNLKMIIEGKLETNLNKEEIKKYDAKEVAKAYDSIIESKIIKAV